VIRDLAECVVWLHDRVRGTLTKLPGSGESVSPRWLTNGDRVAFQHLENGVHHLAWQRVDGTGAPELLARDAGWPSWWSADGRRIVSVKDGDIWIASLDGGKAAAAPLATTPEVERSPELSPDGRWLAYVSNASGRDEVYVQPYPGLGARQLVSLEGGTNPAWSPTGREIFFLSPRDTDGKGHMMVADVRPGPVLAIGRPRPLFPFQQPPLRLACAPVRCYAVAPDGQRFYATQMMPMPPASPVTHIQLVQNWTEELKARVPAGTAR